MIIKDALISTTRGHNIGDEIIYNGVLQILESAGIEIENKVLFNRNPDLQEGPHRHARKLTVGDYDNDIKYQNYDAIILAGSPECFGAPVERLYSFALQSNIPMIIIGAGSGTKNQPLTPLELEVLRRKNTIITTRQQDLANRINELLGETKAKAFICPASFQAYYGGTKSKVLHIVQAPGEGWHKVRPMYLNGADKHEAICFHTTDFIGLDGLAKLTNTVSEAHSKILSAKLVVSTRLHGAIFSLSQGIPAVVVGSGDYRIESAAAMFKEWLPVAENFNHAQEIKLPEKMYKNLYEFISIELHNYAEHLNEKINEAFKA